MEEEHDSVLKAFCLWNSWAQHHAPNKTISLLKKLITLDQIKVRLVTASDYNNM